MKKISMLALASAITLSACAQQKEGDFTIEGTLPDTVKTVMVYADGTKEPVVTGQVTNGKFSVKGNAPKDAFLNIGYMMDGGRPRFITVLNDGEPIEIRLADDYWVKGSKLNNELNEMNLKSDITILAASLIKDWQAARASQDEAKANEIAVKINAIQERCDSIKIAYIANHKNDVTPALLMSQMYYMFDYKELVEYINSGAVWVNHPLCDRMKKQVEAMAKRQPGIKFTDLEMNDLDGNAAKLSNWVGKGNYVLVDFWASWCGPCRREMPHVVKAYQTYKAKGFDVVGVSFDNKAEAWKKAVAELGLEWHNISDLKGWQCAASSAYGINSIPSNILVGPDGIIIASDLRGEDLLNKLAEIYK